MPDAKNTYKIRSRVFLWQGKAAWHFVGIPKEQSDELKKYFGKNARGWGSIPVTITIGKTTWKTSIFPDKKSGTYLLPLKEIIRKKEKISEGDMLEFLLKVLT